MSNPLTSRSDGSDLSFSSYADLFRVSSNGVVSPRITIDGFSPTWLWGDSNNSERGNYIPHTYDEFPPYIARIGDIDRDRIEIFELMNSPVDELFLKSLRQLQSLNVSGCQLVSLSIDRNNSLLSLDVSNNQLISSSIDNIIIQLDNFSLKAGVLCYQSNPQSPTSASSIAYNNLLDKGWVIKGGHV